MRGSMLKEGLHRGASILFSQNFSSMETNIHYHSIKTTMIYIHVLNRGLEVKSPLD